MEVTLKLNRDFERHLEYLKNKLGEDFWYINGVHPEQLDYTDAFDKFVKSDNVANATIDPNANVGHKDLRSFAMEKGKPLDKLYNLEKIFVFIKKKWGIRTAKEWLEQEFSKGFYLNDAATAGQFPYCYAVDLSRLAREGLFFLDNYNNEPPKHFTTFLDDLIEFVSFLGNRQSGAVGLPNIIVWAYWFWKHDCETGYYIKSPEYYLRQCFQKIVYRLNQPFIRIDQTAFTNVSIFDRCYLTELFGGTEFPDGTLAIDCIEEIIECQKVFMDVVSEIREQCMFTFPVLTYSLLYVNGKFEDEEFARWCCTHNIKWSDSNFFVSDNVGILSNCCFDGAQELYYYNTNGEKVLTTFKNYVESKLNQPYSGKQITEQVHGDYVVDPYTNNKIEICAVSKLPNIHKNIIEIKLEDGRILKVTPDQKIYDNNSGKMVYAKDILNNPEAYDI